MVMPPKPSGFDDVRYSSKAVRLRESFDSNPPFWIGNGDPLPLESYSDDSLRRIYESLIRRAERMSADYIWGIAFPFPRDERLHRLCRWWGQGHYRWVLGSTNLIQAIEARIDADPLLPETLKPV